MKHYFKHICYNTDYLFEGTKKLSTFMKRLRDQADSEPDYFEPDTYYGDGFEAFVEVLINVMGKHPSIQINNYSPVDINNDMGVDGAGYGPDSEVHTVQAKARGDSSKDLTANKDHISNFVAHSLLKYKAKYMTIFTTAKGLNESVSNDMYMGAVRTIGWNQLRALVDNNEMFWSEFRDQIKTK